MATAELNLAPPVVPIQRRSRYRDAARRFARNKLSIVGLILVRYGAQAQ